jgi:hypothetical protein
MCGDRDKNSRLLHSILCYLNDYGLLLFELLALACTAELPLPIVPSEVVC